MNQHILYDSESLHNYKKRLKRLRPGAYPRVEHLIGASLGWAVAYYNLQLMLECSLGISSHFGC